jgi:hypothetical protein
MWCRIVRYKFMDVSEGIRPASSSQAIQVLVLLLFCFIPRFLRWRQYVPPKRQWTLPCYTGVTSQNTVLIIVAAMKSSNPLLLIVVQERWQKHFPNYNTALRHQTIPSEVPVQLAATHREAQTRSSRPHAPTYERSVQWMHPQVLKSLVYICVLFITAMPKSWPPSTK